VRPPHKQKHLAGFWSNSDFEFPQKINPQDWARNCGLKKQEVKASLETGLFLRQNPRREMTSRLLPWKGGPDGLLFDWKGIIPKVAPVLTRYLFLVNSSVRKIWRDKDIAVAVACAGACAAVLGTARRRISFPTRCKGHTLMGPLAEIAGITADAIARVLEIREGSVEGGADVGMAGVAPSVAPPPGGRSGTPAMLSRGSGARDVSAAASVPQCIRYSNHCRGHFVIARSCRLTHGREAFWWESLREKGHCQGSAMSKNYFSFPKRMLGFRPSMPRGKRNTSK
jgi:hypothetical protein